MYLRINIVITCYYYIITQQLLLVKYNVKYKKYFVKPYFYRSRISEIVEP